MDMTEEKLVIRLKRLRGEDGHKTFSIRIKSELFEDISNISIQTGRSRNEVINTLLEFAVEQCVIQEEESLKTP